MRKKSIRYLFLFLFSIMALASSCAKKPPKKPQIPQEVAPLSHFVLVESCSPSLTWNPVRLPGAPVVSYDIAIYEAIKVKSGRYAKGGKFIYKENYPITTLTVVPSLLPKKPYLWSVRVRRPDGKVSQWSTNSKTIQSPLPSATYQDHWHGIMTPENCPE